MKTMKRALIVEAEPGLRSLLEKIFKGREFDVRGTDSIEGIVGYLEREDFDVIVVNWTPQWEPWRPLLRAVCTSHPDAVVVVSRLSGSLDLAVELLKAGAGDCLTSPVGLGELVDAAEHALKRRFVAVRAWYDQSVMAIAAAIRLRDVETEEHCLRVAETTVRLCGALGMSEDDRLQSVRWGAFLHDVGKVGIPDRILHKDGPLTPDEREQIRRHPVIGKELLERIPFLQGAIPLVLYHHERFDGRGYPEGLKGDAIPLAARAIAVADTVDAMYSNRPYRPAMTWDQIVDELSDNRGGQFDPAVVDLALSRQDEVFQEYLDCSKREGVAC
jgi:putative nucleotidyltransferase with HDIG domain